MIVLDQGGRMSNQERGPKKDQRGSFMVVEKEGMGVVGESEEDAEDRVRCGKP